MIYKHNFRNLGDPYKNQTAYLPTHQKLVGVSFTLKGKSNREKTQQMLSLDQTDRHCLMNVSNFACQTGLCVWAPRQALRDKYILSQARKMFVKDMFV